MKYTDLLQAVQSAAAFRCRTILQPAGGEGDKVFPPTYAGAVYASEERRAKDDDGQWKTTPCVLLDSVQAQANRLEEALQQAIDDGSLANLVPVIEVDFSQANLLDEVGRITSLEAPHRAADAILRDGLLNGTPFRKSEEGMKLDKASLPNATPLYEICPTALIFGIWDSTGPKGGLGAKFQRALVSEIVGINATYGVKTGSRIDPLAISKHAGPVYRTPNGDWTLDPAEAMEEKGKPVLYGTKKGGAGSAKYVTHDPSSEKFPDQGKPSVLNHGNVTPDFTRYEDNASSPNPLRPGEEVRKNQITGGGVTIQHAEQTIVLSLPALRRLRFPLADGTRSPELDAAGRTVLAALALTSAALAAENGYDLRSRCLLWPTGPLKWELLEKPGEAPHPYDIDRASAIELLKTAVEAAEALGLRWRREPLKLTPSPQLIELIRRSQAIAASESEDPS